MTREDIALVECRTFVASAKELTGKACKTAAPLNSEQRRELLAINARLRVLAAQLNELSVGGGA